MNKRQFILWASLSYFLIGSLANASVILNGIDNRGNPCALALIEGVSSKPFMGEEIRLQAVIQTSYSKDIFHMVKPVYIDDINRSKYPENGLNGGLYDEYQGQKVAVKLNSNNEPVAFSYFDNRHLRFFKPIDVECKLN
jgi:hypothetical protein